LKTLIQGNRKAINLSPPNAMCLVADDGLHLPAGPCCTWPSRQPTGTTLVQLKYLTSCRISGFHTPANFESKLAVKSLMWSANSRTPRSLCTCLLLTYRGHQ